MPYQTIVHNPTSINDEILKARKADDFVREARLIEEKYRLFNNISDEEYARLTLLVRTYATYRQELERIEAVISDLLESSMDFPSMLTQLYYSQTHILAKLGVKMPHPRVQQLRSSEI